MYPGGKVAQYETCPREWEEMSDRNSEGKGKGLIKTVKERRNIAYQKRCHVYMSSPECIAAEEMLTENVFRGQSHTSTDGDTIV